MFAVTHDRDVDLGMVHAGERLKVTRIVGDEGVALVARKVTPETKRLPD